MTEQTGRTQPRHAPSQSKHKKTAPTSVWRSLNFKLTIWSSVRRDMGNLTMMRCRTIFNRPKVRVGKD